MERDDFLVAAWDGLLEGMKATAGDARSTAIIAEKETFFDIIIFNIFNLKSLGRRKGLINLYIR